MVLDPAAVCDGAGVDEVVDGVECEVVDGVDGVECELAEDAECEVVDDVGCETAGAGFGAGCDTGGAGCETGGAGCETAGDPPDDVCENVVAVDARVGAAVSTTGGWTVGAGGDVLGLAVAGAPAVPCTVKLRVGAHGIDGRVPGSTVCGEPGLPGRMRTPSANRTHTLRTGGGAGCGGGVVVSTPAVTSTS